jgi:hypothetical protein
MQHKSDAPDSLIEFIQDVGIPAALHSDDAKELVQDRMGQIIRKAWMKPSQSEPYSPWQNRAEIAIKAIKKSVCQTMARTQAPSHLWDYCTIYHCELNNLTAHSLFHLHGRTPY